MKHKRRFASLATAALLAACAVVPVMSALPASAATADTITLTQIAGDKASHTYTAYKIFDGVVTPKTVGDVTTNELTGIQWATGISTDASTGFLAKLKASTLVIGETEGENPTDITLGSLFTDCDTAASVASVLMENNTNETMVRQFAEFVKAQGLTAVGTGGTSANGTNASITLPAASGENAATANDGYYLIVDAITGTAPVQDSATSRYILQTVDASEGLEVEVKSSLPTVVKKVKENTDVDDYGTRAVDADYNDVADYNIGDSVPFRLYGTLPTTLTDYDTYKYVFHDTLGKEFTLADGFAVTVEVVDSDGTTKATLTKDTDYELATTTASGEDNNTITVTIDDVTAITNIAATDQIIVSYSAVLNQNAEIGTPGQTNEVYLEYSNNPNSGGEGSTGKTPPDKVIVFTYELDVTKVDAGTNTALKDAEFVLFRGSGENTEYAVLNDDMKVTDWLKGTLTVADGTISFSKTSSANRTNATAPTVLKSDTDGNFKVIGLDDGTYSLKETKAPSGYNLLTSDVELTIDATTSNGQNEDASGDELTAIKVSVTGDSASVNGTGDAAGVGNVTDGTVSLNVKNNSGSTLPSTGGIGTTIFYVAGGVLVVGAGVLLITKKRAKNAE